MPWSTALIQATDGNFYGTTFQGGAYGQGTVFKVTPNGELTTLYSFCAQAGCPDGAGPNAGLVQASDGNFYGTSGGGSGKSGTIFKITPEGTLTTLHSFNGADGSSPGPLIQATNGNFYGTTYGGGNIQACPGDPGCGTIFEFSAGGKLTTLYAFGGPNGQGPENLIQANDGNFCGTTAMGGVVSDLCSLGSTCGTVFEMTPTGQLTTLYKFQGSDGWWPGGGLLQGADGNFYGATFHGGAGNACNGQGCGTVFVITPAGKLTTLHSFALTDGTGPAAPLVQATDGNLYGTTGNGGPTAEVTCQTPGMCPAGWGTIFEITTEGEFTNLYNFDSTDGALPLGGLVQATDGNFYGTTNLGGNGYSGCGLGGCGTVFSLSTGLAPFVKLAPASGDAGVAVTILGTGLTDATKVTFNGKAAQFKIVSSTEIQATVPAEASTGKVEVTTPQGALSSNVPFQVPLHPEVRHGRF